MSDAQEPTYAADFTEEIQKQIVEMMFYDRESFLMIRELVKPQYFENQVLSDLVQIMLNFYHRYGRCIEFDEFTQELDVFLDNSARPLPREVYTEQYAQLMIAGAQVPDFRYVRDQVVSWAQYQMVKLAILRSINLLQKKRDYVGILKEVKDAVMLGEVTHELGSFYYEELEQRLEERKSGWYRGEITVPTGIGSLDQRLGGGLAIGELGILMGPTKRGKTITLVNFARGALLRGRNVLHIGMESTERRTQVLYDAHFSGIAKDQLRENEEEVRKRVTEFFTTMQCGTLVVKHFPPVKCTSATIEAHLQKLRNMKNLKIDVLLIDYLGLMGPAGKLLDKEGGKYALLGQITKELLALAQEYELAIWLIHQSTRGTLSKGGEVEVIGLVDSGDSIEPMRDADIILTFNQSEEEARVESEDGFQDCRIYLAGGREIADKWSVPLKINKAKCLLVEPSMVD
jgi:replicative DNA helicase